MTFAPAALAEDHLGGEQQSTSNQNENEQSNAVNEAGPRNQKPEALPTAFWQIPKGHRTPESRSPRLGNPRVPPSRSGRMGQEEFLNPVPIKTLCEIFMEERGHILHGGQSEQAVEGKTGKGVDGLVSGKPLRGTPSSRNPSKVPLNRILDESELNPKPMHTYTPGPWYITKDTTSGEFCTYTKVRDQRDGVIAIMSTMNENSNAHLIATAPELLEALKWALEQIADDLDPDFQEALENAQAVVERAGGYL